MVCNPDGTVDHLRGLVLRGGHDLWMAVARVRCCDARGEVEDGSPVDAVELEPGRGDHRQARPILREARRQPAIDAGDEIGE